MFGRLAFIVASVAFGVWFAGSLIGSFGDSYDPSIQAISDYDDLARPVVSVAADGAASPTTLIFSEPCFEFDPGSGCSQADDLLGPDRVELRSGGTLVVNPPAGVARVQAWVGHGDVFNFYEPLGPGFRELRRISPTRFVLPASVSREVTAIVVDVRYEHPVGAGNLRRGLYEVLACLRPRDCWLETNVKTGW